jgi:hypothetical protein
MCGGEAALGGTAFHGEQRLVGNLRQLAAERRRDRFLALDPSLRRSLRVGRSLSGGKNSCVGGKKYAPHF